jgi:hypothetical protein
MATRVVLFVALVVGIFLFWVDAASIPLVVHLREGIGEGPALLFGTLLTFVIWVYCLYWAWRTRRWEWVVIDLMLPIALPLQILFGPVSLPNKPSEW